MVNGQVVSINLAPEATAKPAPVPQVRAVPGRGLEGDRYFLKKGTGSGRAGPGRDLTLIEVEAIEALERDYEVKIDPAESRRNVVTRGVALNHLVGREFRLGEVTVRGVRLCEPCSHLQRLVGQEKVLPGLVHRGGLRCDIITEGVIRAGDKIELA